MPEFMDGLAPWRAPLRTALLDAHHADLAIQEDEAVDFKHAWADLDTGLVGCLSEAPSKEAVMTSHERAEHPADAVYPVPVRA